MKTLFNFDLIFTVISRNLFIISASLLLTGIVAVIYHEPVFSLIISSAIAALIGYVLFYFTATGEEEEEEDDEVIRNKEAYFSVTLSWLTIALFGSLPYILSGSIPHFIDAFFESVSGFTTTGSSILTDIEALPRSIIFWRSLTHWIGGIGIIVLFIIIIPSYHMGSYHLFTLESSLHEKIMPKIRSVGFRLLLIYLGLTFLEILFLLGGGMNLFESICHAFGTVATGGFSPKNTSIAGYSPYIQYVIMIFMLLAGTNFLMHYYIVKREFRKVKENDELKFFLITVLVLGLIVSSILIFHQSSDIEKSFRDGFFQVISIVTCTGFATADYLKWPSVAMIIIFFAMFLGGSTGSTAGGIKIARHIVLFKNIGRVFKQLAKPNAILSLKLNNKPVSDWHNLSILSFIFFYMFIFLIGFIILAIIGLDFETAAGSVATCMAGIGPGLGTVGPAGNFAHLPDAAKLLLTFLMIIGRLEIYTIIMLFTKEYWRQ